MHEQRELFDAARELVSDLGMLPEDLEAVGAMRRQLDELFLIIVVGEFNSGKSTFLNALLGEDVLETGELPTTRQVHLLRHGPVQSVREAEPGLLIHELPSRLLEDLNIVDTPGTNSMQRKEQALTEGFVPRADLVFFLTSLVRPYAASEHEFLRLIHSWGKQIVFVINQVDLASGRDHVARVRRYVQQQVQENLGEERPLYAISAREVVETRASGGPDAALSGQNEYAKLEEYVTGTLRERERVRLKLRAPLESLRTVLTRQEAALAERLRLVQGDRGALDAILSEVDAYEGRMRGEVTRYQSQITNILWQLERRGDRFFDELVRLANIMRLRNKDIVENRFRVEVVADTPQKIESEIQALIDWLVRQNLVMWEKADTTLESRRAALHEAAARTRWMSPEFVYNREEIFRNMAQPVRRRLEAFDARQEADAIVTAVNEAIAKTFGVQALVIGLGAVLTAAFTTLSIDFTGTIGATLVVIAGLFILPHRRGRLKRELAGRVETLREELSQTLEARFYEQLCTYVQQLRDAFTPELEATRARAARLREAGARLRDLQARCDKLLEAAAAA
ncbi:MAG: dynamin family protein [Candidatus Krumholzibacteriia bacterium]